MPTDTITPTLVINKLTKAQYEGIVNPSDTELYLVPDDDLREHRSYYTTGTATVDGETVDVDIMYEGVAPEGSVETDAVWTITTIVATLDGNVLSNDVDTDQTWDYPTPTPVVPVIDTRPPICYPTTASEVKPTSMVVKSSVSDNGKILTENGFVYNTSGNPTVSDTKVICDLGVGFFEKKLENLTQNTEYHIKSYGQNASGLVYGSELVQRTIYSPIPDEYQLVEYLESSGTQYINIGLNLIAGLEFEIEGYIIGMGVHSGSSSSVSGTSLFFNGIKRVCSNYCFYISSWIQVPDGASDIVKIKLYNGAVSILNNDDTIRISRNIINISRNIFLFASNGSNGIFYTSSKITKAHFKNIDANIEKDMYPVYQIADNKPGMYDIVNGVFYTNQGTGEFVVGPDKEWEE